MDFRGKLISLYQVKFDKALELVAFWLNLARYMEVEPMECFYMLCAIILLALYINVCFDFKRRLDS